MLDIPDVTHAPGMEVGQMLARLDPWTVLCDNRDLVHHAEQARRWSPTAWCSRRDEEWRGTSSSRVPGEMLS